MLTDKTVREYLLTVVNPGFAEEEVMIESQQKGNMEKVERESECHNPDLELCFNNQSFRRII